MEHKVELFESALGSGQTPGMAERIMWSKHIDTEKIMALRMPVMQ